MFCSLVTNCEGILALSSGRVTSGSRQSTCKSCHAQGVIMTPCGQHRTSLTSKFFRLGGILRLEKGKFSVSLALRRAPYTARLPPRIRPVRSGRRNLPPEAGCARHRAVGENRLHLRG